MIRWITETLGTAPADSLPEIRDFAVVDVRELVDKPGNPPAAVKDKIDEAITLLRKGNRVVVCCDFGISRSNALAAGILAAHQQLDLNAAIRLVQKATGESAIKLELLSAVRIALGEQPRTPSSTRRILVTGAGGFIGRHLLRDPLPNIQFIPSRRTEIDLIKDATALDLLAREMEPDTLVHLASPHSYTSNEAMGQSITMLKNVLDVCRENKLRLIYLSSWEVYSGYWTTELQATEELPARPGGNYGQTKYLCELLLKSYREIHGVEMLLLRSSPVFGPGADRPKLIYNFLNKAQKGEPITTHQYRNGFPAIDLLFIEDLVGALRLSIAKSIAGEFNLGNGIAIETREIAQEIIRLTNSSSAINYLDIEGYAYNVVMNSKKAEHILNWKPSTDWQAGLKAIVESASQTAPQKTQ